MKKLKFKILLVLFSIFAVTQLSIAQASHRLVRKELIQKKFIEKTEKIRVIEKFDISCAFFNKKTHPNLFRNYLLKNNIVIPDSLIEVFKCLIKTNNYQIAFTLKEQTKLFLINKISKKIVINEITKINLYNNYEKLIKILIKNPNIKDAKFFWINGISAIFLIADNELYCYSIKNKLVLPAQEMINLHWEDIKPIHKIEPWY